MARYVTFLMMGRDSCAGLVCEGVQGERVARKPFTAPQDAPTSASVREKVASVAQGVSRSVSEICQRNECQIVLVLHREEFSILRLVLPPSTDDEIASMLELEIPSQLPVDIEQICYGWERIGETPSGEVRIEIYWSPLGATDSLIEELQRAGLTTLAILPTLSVYRRLLQPLNAERPTLFVRATRSDFEIVRYGPDGQALLSRGKRNASDSPGENVALMTELHRFWQSSADGVEEPCDDTLVCLAPEEMRSRVDSGLGPMNASDSDTARRFEEMLGRIGNSDPYPWFPLLAAADGAANGLRGEYENLRANMLPKAMRKGRETARVRRLAIHSSLLFVLFLCLAWANLWYYEYEMQRQLAQNRAEIARFSPIVKQVDAMQERIRSIRDQIDYALSPIDAVAKISSVFVSNGDTLEGLYLDKMDYQSSGRIVLEGHSINDITPWRFADSLAKSGTFRVEQGPRIVTTPYGDTRTIRFQLALDVSNDAANPLSKAEDSK